MLICVSANPAIDRRLRIESIAVGGVNRALLTLALKAESRYFRHALCFLRFADRDDLAPRCSSADSLPASRDLNMLAGRSIY